MKLKCSLPEINPPSGDINEVLIKLDDDVSIKIEHQEADKITSTVINPVRTVDTTDVLISNNEANKIATEEKNLDFLKLNIFTLME